MRQHQPLFRPADNNPLSRVASSKQAYHTADLRQEEAYVAGDPAIIAMVDRAGARSLVNVPMLKDDELPRKWF
jgi:hypothetical protein